MSLDWDLTKVKDRDKMEYDFGDGLIWATMYIGMDKITPDNASEFYARLTVYNDVIGNIWNMTKGKDDKLHAFFPTFDQLKLWIGLKTNASTMTKACFMACVKKILSSRLDGLMQENC